MRSCIHLSYLLIAMFAYGVCGDKGICAISPSASTSLLTPVALLKALKEGTGKKTQLKIALFRYMSQEAEKANDQVTWYTPEAGHNKDIIKYVGFEKDWAVINRRTLVVLKTILKKLKDQDSSVRLDGLDEFTKLMLALEITATPQKEQIRALRLLIGQLYFFPSLYFKESKNMPFLSERMLRIGFFHASSFFDMGKEFYPLGIEAYKHLLKTHATHPSSQSHYVYWISWGYLQLKQYDEAIAWARKMPPCIGMTEAPARLEKWARQAKARQKKKKR